MFRTTPLNGLLRSAADPLGLPRPFTIRDYPGSLTDYIDHLYWDYRVRLFAADVRIWDKPVIASGNKASDGRDATFWHLITNSSPDHMPDQRTLSLERCAHLPRVWPILEWLAKGDLRVCSWHERGNMLFVAPVDFSQLIVLRERKGAFCLKTSYPALTVECAQEVFNRALMAWTSSSPAPAPTTLLSVPRQRSGASPWRQRGIPSIQRPATFVPACAV